MVFATSFATMLLVVVHTLSLPNDEVGDLVVEEIHEAENRGQIDRFLVRGNLGQAQDFGYVRLMAAS